MGKIRKLLIGSIAVLGIVSLGGCTMINKGIDAVKSKVTSSESGKYYSNEEEAKTKIISMLNDKYKIKFSIAGNESYKKTGAGIVFSTAIKDSSGLKATASLAQDKNISFVKETGNGVAPGLKDTYLQTYYTKKTRDAVEPLFQGEPFTKYFIYLATPQNAKKILGLSVENYFLDSGDSYNFEVILPHKNSVKEYADIIYPFYQKLITKQHNPFTLECFSDNKQVFLESYIDSKHFNGNDTYADIVDNITGTMMHDHQQPKDEYLGSPYYN
ncbi:hypothetical protein ACJDT4_20700 [Clostridium neuense]|uniref:Lipoprotein n=1 Tax=Clostridium neuense TaxID=1728934 RepID=A0ABW8TLU5_9CLOT